MSAVACALSSGTGEKSRGAVRVVIVVVTLGAPQVGLQRVDVGLEEQRYGGSDGALHHGPPSGGVCGFEAVARVAPQRSEAASGVVVELLPRQEPLPQLLDFGFGDRLETESDGRQCVGTGLHSHVARGQGRCAAESTALGG